MDIMKYSHYSLNIPLFAHFTSPSRRFADLIVHRQLKNALEKGKFYWNYNWCGLPSYIEQVD